MEAWEGTFLGAAGESGPRGQREADPEPWTHPSSIPSQLLERLLDPSPEARESLTPRPEEPERGGTRVEYPARQKVQRRILQAARRPWEHGS